MNPIRCVIQNIPNYNGVNYIAQPEIVQESVAEVPFYTYERTNKVHRIAMAIMGGILSVILLPYGIYRLFQLLAGAFVVPAQVCKGEAAKKYGVLNISHRDFVRWLKNKLEEDSTLVAKRINVLVNGKLVDAMIFGRKQTLANQKWTLVSNPNCTDMRTHSEVSFNFFDRCMKETDSNFLFYDYPGVGSSHGLATRDRIVETHKAMLRFLEDGVRGIGAKTILQIGTSLGGGVQGHVMKDHALQKGIRYVLVKHDTFSKISRVPGPVLGGLLKLLGWELSCDSSSERMEREGIPEIILQCGSKKQKRVVPADVRGDGVISSEASHAYAVLTRKNPQIHKKVILRQGFHGMTPSFKSDKLFRCIAKALSPDYQGFHAECPANAIT